MRTADAFLRQGVAAHMLDYIIDAARERGLGRLSLETGSSGVFEPAIALYQRYGFTECEPFADYKPDPFSRFRSEEHTSELQSLMRISYAVFCLKIKKII